MQYEFQSTHWSAVMIAGRDASPDAQLALASLCETYWYPLYAYARRRVSNVDEAHDLTQAFFAEFLEKNYVSDADPNRGKFRAFLLTAFKHFLSKQWQKAKAEKRGGGRSPIPLDFDRADSQIRIEPADGLTPEELYDRQWTITLLERILDRLREELDRAGRGEQFHALKGFIVGDHSGTTYAVIADQLGVSEAAAKKTASRMRQRYRELLREEIARTLGETENVDDEIQSLFASLG